jgi:hypothetical protein
MPIVEIVTIASRPDLADLLGQFPMGWPAFMYQDRTGDLYYADAATAHPDFVMLAVDDGRPVARLFSVPLAWDGDPRPGRSHVGRDVPQRGASRLHRPRRAGPTQRQGRSRRAVDVIRVPDP